MKIAPNQVAGTLADPSRFAGILLYGEDSGLVRDRAGAATVAIVGAASDPFRLSMLAKEEHGRLAQEVTSMSLGGGRRVVRVMDATDGLTAALGKLGDHRADALIVMEGVGLTPRSKLRAWAEARADWAAIPCYLERPAAISAEIKRTLADAGLRADPDAVAYLAVELAGESGRRRAEMEKLVLYAAGAGVVTIQDAQACCTAELDASLGAAVSACLAGNLGRCDALLQELQWEGATGQGLLAMLSMQVHRLLRVRAAMADGRSAEDAARSLTPPVFGQHMPGFLAEVDRWPVASLMALGRAVHDADVACKRAGSADLAIAGRLLHAAAAARPRR